MITLTIKNNVTVQINLVNFDREKKLAAAWKTFRGDPSYNKRLVIKAYNIDINFNDIVNCEFEDAVFLASQHLRGAVGYRTIAFHLPESDRSVSDAASYGLARQLVSGSLVRRLLLVEHHV